MLTMHARGGQRVGEEAAAAVERADVGGVRLDLALEVGDVIQRINDQDDPRKMIGLVTLIPFMDEPVTAANTALAPTVAMPIPPVIRRNPWFITA